MLEKSLDGCRVDSAGTRKSGGNAIRLEELFSSWKDEALAAMFTMLTRQDYVLADTRRFRRQDLSAVRQL